MGQPCVVLASMCRGGCIQTMCFCDSGPNELHYPECMCMYRDHCTYIYNIVPLAVMQHIVQYNGNCHNINCRSGIL